MQFIYNYWNGSEPNTEENQSVENEEDQFNASSAIEHDISQLQLNQTEAPCLEMEKRYEVINITANQLMEQNLSAEHRRLLDELIDRLKDDFPHEVQSTATLIRFLRARKWKLKETEHMFRNRMKWIHHFKPHLIPENDVLPLIAATKQAFWIGKDKCGRPVLMIKCDKVSPKKTSPEILWKSIVYMMEKGLEMLPPPPHNQYIVLYDMHGFGLKNLDLNQLKRFSMLGDLYPETLHKVFILNYSIILKALMSVFRSIMDPATAEKVELVGKDQLFEKLSVTMDTMYIEKNYGGTCEKALFPPVEI